MRTKNMHRDGPLRVRVAGCIASKWLLPRLNALQQRHPDLKLEVTVSSEIFEFRYNEMDALIRLRKGDFTGMHVTPFFTEHVAPVCSPDFLRRHGPLAAPADLLNVPLIHDDILKVIPTYPDCAMWLAAAGVDFAARLPGHQFDSSSMALDAAMQGRGVALGRSGLVARDLEAGNLIRVCDFVYPVTHEYHLIYPNTTLKLKQLKKLYRWLTREAESTSRSWSRAQLECPS